MRKQNLLTLNLLGAMLLSLISSVSWANSPENLKQARAYEKKAFTYIEMEDWCAATNSFLDAYEKAPIADYLFNAAKAVRLAGDRTQAMQLNMKFIVEFRNSSLITEVNQNNKELSDEMAQKGPGLACPRSPAVQNVPAAPSAPSASTSPTTPSSPEPAPTNNQPIRSTPPPPTAASPMLPPEPEQAMSSKQKMPIGVLAAGSVLTVAGAWGVYWGSASYNRGLQIWEDLESNPNNPDLNAEYDAQKNAWETRDMPILIVGTGALIGGLAGVGLVTWWYINENQE